ncbi:MAG: C25 family cysteine peptidase [Brevefilum sp.]|nr:C25 family cysteine peptidase [Brevefilum sp.]
MDKHKDRKPIRGKLIIILMIGMIIGSFYRTTSSAEPLQMSIEGPNDLYPYLTMVSSTAESIVLEFTPPRPEFIQMNTDSGGCQSPSILGLSNSAGKGQPELPSQGVLIGMPVQAQQPNLEVISANTITLDETYQLCAGQDLEVNSIERDIFSLPELRTAQISPVNQFLPVDPAVLVSQGMIRNQAYISLQFNPIQYNSYSGVVQYTSNIRVEINFNAPQTSLDVNSQFIEDPYFEDNYQRLLINYEQAKAWRKEPTSTALRTDPESTLVEPESFYMESPLYKITVTETGIYQLNYTDLAGAGLPVDTLDPHTLKLFYQDQEIPIRVIGEADGSFDDGDTILFFGEQINSLYTEENVYWLGYDGEDGLRMEGLDGSPSDSTIPEEFLKNLRIEKDNEYFWEAPSGTYDDNWYTTVIYGNGSVDIPFNLPALSPIGHEIQLRGLVRPYDYNNGLPHLRLYINGAVFFDDVVSDNEAFNIDTTLGQSDLLEGVNTLTIETVASPDILINWFELDYFGAYHAVNDLLYFDGEGPGSLTFHLNDFSTDQVEILDITDPFYVKNIENASIVSTVGGFQVKFDAAISEEHHYLALSSTNFLSPASINLDTDSNWKSPTNGADYIIVSHADFLDAMQPLVDFRENQGYRVVLVDVQDVYDEFNGGVFDPNAIQTFLQYAYENWTTPAPSFVLLVGDGHWDYKNAYGTGELNYIPPILADVDPWMSETATDNAFVSVSGDDNLPDLHLGRFPVSTVAEAQAMVANVLSYEQTPPASDWNTKLTFLADNADSGGDYAAESDDAITVLPVDYTADKIYYGVNYTDAGLAKSDFIANINEGRLIIHYAGHAGFTQWASEKLFSVSNLSSLTNAGKLPLVLPMTCIDGYYVYPGIPSLGESIVRMNDTGAIASFSPTGYGLTSGHSVMAESILDHLFNKYYTQLGYLTTQAKYDLFAASPSQSYLLDTYMLFGDPALRLQTVPVDLDDPSDLAAAAVSNNQIDLSWTDNSDPESAFLIERSPSGLDGTWMQIASLEENATTYSDTGLSKDTTYFYRVRAYRFADDQYSDYTNTASATTLNLPETPTDLAALSVSTQQINLSWTDNADDETAYTIERSPDGVVDWTLIAEISADATAYSDTGLTPGTTYYYRVRAYRAIDQQYSPYSNVASAVTDKLINLFLPIIFH